jgi:hypothetical protein
VRLVSSPDNLTPTTSNCENLQTNPKERMSLPSTAHKQGFNGEPNQRRDDLEIQEEDRSPALSIQDEEDEGDDEDDHRALLSSTIVRRGDNNSANKQNERSKLRNMSHVSNWRYMKDIFVEVSLSFHRIIAGKILTTTRFLRRCLP